MVGGGFGYRNSYAWMFVSGWGKNYGITLKDFQYIQVAVDFSRIQALIYKTPYPFLEEKVVYECVYKAMYANLPLLIRF